MILSDSNVYDLAKDLYGMKDGRMTDAPDLGITIKQLASDYKRQYILFKCLYEIATSAGRWRIPEIAALRLPHFTVQNTIDFRNSLGNAIAPMRLEQAILDAYGWDLGLHFRSYWTSPELIPDEWFGHSGGGIRGANADRIVKPY